MSRSFTFVDPLALDDLRVFASRAARVEDGSLRLIRTGGVLAAYGAVLYPHGLLDETPTVLALRTFAVDDGGVDGAEDFDAVVPVRSLLQRLENARDRTVTLPMEVHTVTWAGISPPKGGWVGHGQLPPRMFADAARTGMQEVADAMPDSVGAHLVQRVRSEVWGRELDGAEHIPAGAAFAAVSMGFLGEDPVRIFETGPWTRLTTERGHVLVKRRAWTLAR